MPDPNAHSGAFAMHWALCLGKCGCWHPRCKTLNARHIRTASAVRSLMARDRPQSARCAHWG